MTDVQAAPKPMHFLLAWDAADLVVECLAQDLPRWRYEPWRQRMHEAVFVAIVRELKEAG